MACGTGHAKAIGRLAYWADIIGDARMQQYVSNARCGAATADSLPARAAGPRDPSGATVSASLSRIGFLGVVVPSPRVDRR